ncbi:MAG: hypothetical protein Aurels2KO_22450 [Aureliella sp.]
MTTPVSQSSPTAHDKRQAYVVDADDAQQRMWFLERLWANEGAYNVAVAVRVKGQVDPDQLQSAINTTVSRHETLRTGFEDEDDTLKQIIHFERPIELVVREVAEAEIDDHIARSAKRNFDLQADPLLHIELLQIANGDCILVLVLHHIIADERSVTNLYAELSAQMANPDAQLPELHVQYADYSAWQQKRLKQATLGSQIDYWKRRFAALPAPLDLPVDRPRPAIQSTAGDRYEFYVSAGASQRLIRFCRSSGTTLFAGVVAAYTALLAKLTNQTDLVVGTPTANRNRPELEPLIGMFLNTVMLRSTLDATTSFRDLLAVTQQESLAALANQDVPFDRLVQVLRPPRDASRAPVFQTMVTFQGEPFVPQTFGNCKAEWYPTDRGVARFELSLYAEVADGKLLCELEYNKDLFDRDTIVRFAEYFDSLIQQATLRPEAPLLGLNILPHTERQLLIQDRNTTRREWPVGSVLETIRSHAQLQPHKVAAQCAKHSFTYADIDRRLTSVAHTMKRLGVKPGDRVAVCMDRTADVVCWLLGIWQSGAAYVPIDPYFPRERRQHIADDSRCVAMVVDSTTAAEIDFSGTVVHAEELDTTDKGALPYEQDALSAAYVIYTSGSTGRPKGVSIPHRAVNNFLRSMQRTPGFTDEDILLSVTTLSFDISVLELFLPLISGGRVIVANHSQTLDGRELSGIIASHGVTVMQATPATWQLMLEAGFSSSERPLKILCGGEALSAELASALLNTGAELWNMYGPTETTVWSSVQQVSNNTLRDYSTVPIGTPIANTQFFILNESFSLVPRGVCGQLFIGGDGLATEYLHRPKLTQEKFVNSKLVSGKRLYATGDLVRTDANGNMLFVGRSDFQVKVRGFRIELGEIESAIEKVAGTEQVVVSHWPTQANSQEDRLVAYLVQPESDRLDASQLRNQLREELPDYMLPSHFIWLDSFPLTPNRKVDRKRLPAPVIAAQPQAGSKLKQPSNELEAKLAEQWRSALGVSEIGVDQDFFELGGHSLVAARVMRAAEQIVGARLPLALLLAAPTVELLASSIQRQTWRGDWQSLVPLRESGLKPPLFCVHAAGGNVLLYRDLTKRLDENRPVYGLQSEALDGNLPEADCVEQIAARYIDEIRSVQPLGPYHICGYCLGGTIAYEMAQQLRQSGQIVGTVALFDTHRKWLDYSPATQLYANWQQIYFHAANVVLSGRRGVRAFLHEKMREWKRRRTRKKQAQASQNENAAGESIDAPLHVLDGFYDAISEAYEPKKFEGRLTIFRPKSAYVGYDSETLGWSGVATDLNVVSLPVYPAGMLLEPFVAELTTELNAELDLMDESLTTPR